MSGDGYSDDLEASRLERTALWRWRLERLAATIAVSAVGLWIGGLVALGVCAAPFVFRLTPAPHSGYAMAAAFARLDAIAMGCGVVLLGCEVVRTVLQRGSHHGAAVRVRRYLAILMAAGAIYTGMVLTPGIQGFFAAGARRGVGPEGQHLEALHVRAERIGKALVPLALAVIALHLYTLRSREQHEDELERVDAPLPPGREPPDTVHDEA